MPPLLLVSCAPRHGIVAWQRACHIGTVCRVGLALYAWWSGILRVDTVGGHAEPKGATRVSRVGRSTHRDYV